MFTVEIIAARKKSQDKTTDMAGVIYRDITGFSRKSKMLMTDEFINTSIFLKVVFLFFFVALFCM